MDFQAFENDIRKNRWNVFGAEVYQCGILVHSFGDTEKVRHPVYSATKSVLSIAVGMAYDEGKFDLNRCILDYMPGSALKEMTKEQRESFAQITVERLLTMSVAGFPFRPEGESYLKYALSCPLPDVRERKFDYSNISAYLAGVALTNAIGEDLYRYLERKLFNPLHINKPGYTRCSEGYFYGASGMKMSVHELSQVGLLLYHNGLYEGKRLLSEEYIRKATGIRQMNREGGYGYFFWKYRDGFSINGKWKQKCYILPKEELMITYLSHIEDDSEDLLHSMETHILGGKQDGN